jgi:LmbE family N-acetylglucosaminyl deacetylase
MAATSLRESVAASLQALGRRWSRERLPTIELQAPAIVFAPHPDDEVLGCGGTITLKVQAGAAVQVVIMTDGRTSHTPFIDQDTLIRMRREEALAASRVLGLEPSDYHFLEFEDSRLRDSANAARERVARLLEQFQPQQVFVPHSHDRIPDHMATFDIVRAAVTAHAKPVMLLEYPVWLWNTWPWSAARPSLRQLVTGAPQLVRDIRDVAFGCNTRIDIRSVLQRKLDALAQYRSQMYRPPGSPEWPVLADVSNGSFLACFAGHEEVFRRTDAGS